MAIKYSLSVRPSNPSEKNSKKLVYPTAQYAELVDLNLFAQHIHDHGSPFTRDVILGVLMAAVDCLREQLIAGNKVNFGDLGFFHVTLRSDGVERAEDFNPEIHVKSVEATWTRSKFFDNLKDANGLRWEFMPTHKQMAEFRKESKELATEAAEGDNDQQKPDEGNGSGGGNNNGDGGIDE